MKKTTVNTQRTEKLKLLQLLSKRIITIYEFKLIQKYETIPSTFVISNNLLKIDKTEVVLYDVELLQLLKVLKKIGEPVLIIPYIDYDIDVNSNDFAELFPKSFAFGKTMTNFTMIEKIHFEN